MAEVAGQEAKGTVETTSNGRRKAAENKLEAGHVAMQETSKNPKSCRWEREGDGCRPRTEFAAIGGDQNDLASSTRIVRNMIKNKGIKKNRREEDSQTDRLRSRIKNRNINKYQ